MKTLFPRLASGLAAAAFALAFALPVQAACDNCGTVSDLKTFTKEGEGTGLGAVAGGVLGGVLGHQVGSGRGNTAATVVGAGAGAYAGHQVEKKQRTKTIHRVVVKMENGKVRHFDFAEATAYRVGDRVKVVGGKLKRD